jgi:hypothetical protein
MVSYSTAMSDPYPILELSVDSPDVIEQLGSKEKFWFRMAQDEQPWLFKFTREGTGEDWSEKIAAELAVLLRVPAAKVELAKFMGRRGCASRSFVETKKGFDLIHGSEVLAGRVLGYQKLKRWHQSDHSIKNIIAAVENTFPTRQQIPQLRTLAGFIVLDALICNTDRHPDNWALLRGPGPKGKTVHSIAPSFDHASSLGRELRDERRKRILEQGSVERYALKGHGGIYWEESDEKGENPLQLALKAAGAYPNYFKPWLARVRELRPEDFCGIVERVPVEWMSIEARQFSAKLIAVTVARLKTIEL